MIRAFGSAKKLWKLKELATEFMKLVHFTLSEYNHVDDDAQKIKIHLEIRFHLDTIQQISLVLLTLSSQRLLKLNGFF